MSQVERERGGGGLVGVDGAVAGIQGRAAHTHHVCILTNEISQLDLIY